MNVWLKRSVIGLVLFGGALLAGADTAEARRCCRRSRRCCTSGYAGYGYGYGGGYVTGGACGCGY